MSLSQIKVNDSVVTIVDDEPILESKNLVKSGGVEKNITVKSKKENNGSDLNIIDKAGNILAKYEKGIHITKYPAPYTKKEDSYDFSLRDEA